MDEQRTEERSDELDEVKELNRDDEQKLEKENLVQEMNKEKRLI